MLNHNNIENLFRDSFEGFSVKPSQNLWTRINRKLMLKDFFSFKPGKFNAYYTLLIIAAGTVLMVSLNNSKIKQSNTVTAEINEKSDIVNSENSNITNDDQNNETSEILSVTENESNEVKNNNNLQTDQINPHSNIVINDINAKDESNNEGNENKVKLAKPYANFNTSEDEACEPAAISFFNASENCDSYYWEFGNGETSSLKNPTFVFRSAGIYSVHLTVTSGSYSDSFSKEIKVKTKPVADIQLADKKNLFINEDISFSNLSSDCGKNRWNFGDGNISTFTNPVHAYSTPGNYDVSLICYNQFNCSDTAYLYDLKILDEKYKIEVPTAIYINLNGAENGYWKGNNDPNTVFHPFMNYDVSKYNLVIYSKTGSVVFSSNDLDFGWNGYFNNKAAPDNSTYVWRCTGTFIDGTKFNEVGNFSLFYSRQ